VTAQGVSPPLGVQYHLNCNACWPARNSRAPQKEAPAATLESTASAVRALDSRIAAGTQANRRKLLIHKRKQRVTEAGKRAGRAGRFALLQIPAFGVTRPRTAAENAFRFSARPGYAQEMKLSLVAAILAGTTVWAADPVPMDVKTGQWETTINSQTNGLPQLSTANIPPEQLAKMPPEMRAKIEAALKKAGEPKTTVNKGCITKAQLTTLNLDNDKNPSCKRTLVSSSRTRQEIHLDCELGGAKQTGTVVVEAVNPESMKFSVQVNSAGNGPQFNLNTNGTSKWLGPVCTETK
jgi:hypothetical protein